MSQASPQSLQMVMSSVQRERPIVLHVDDDVASLLMAEGALEDAGFDVLHAADGIEAIDMYREHEPDLVIMDAVMPVMDGFEAISGIRKLPGGMHVPILMITGLEDLDSITRAYDEGVTDFLTKPVNFYILPYRVQYLLRSKLTADALRVSQSKLDNAQRIARLGNWEWCLSSHGMSWSREFGRVLGLTEGQTVDNWNEFLDRIVDADRHSVRLMAEHAVEEKQPFNIEFCVPCLHDDSSRRIRLEAEPYCVESGECTHMMGTIQDITERTNAQKQIHNLAYFDLVTGLPNRAQLNEQLRYTLKLAKRNQGKFALLFLDLDHFKQVNDTLGHDAGDDLLKQVSGRLTSVVRGGDMVSSCGENIDGEEAESQHTVARLGGDEFVVLLGQVNRAEDAARVAERIAQSISAPYDIGGQNVSVTTTIGISVFPADGVTSEVLMKNADVAMYHAKESGRNGYQFYSRQIHEQALARFSLESELKSAIENEQLTLVYQPKVNICDGSVSGVEALIRWDHEEHGTVSPNDFIPLAEETGLILPLGRWVLCEATRQMQNWIEAGMEPLVIAVNCSSVQFTRSDMITDINTAIAYSGLDPHLLEIELTESLLLQDIELGIRILRDMKALGIQVAIDDFGTGFSSLSYLKRLPVDKLKIDRSFVKDLGVDAGDVAIVSAIITLSHNLNLTVVAEGVETRQQYDILHGFDCNEAQGFLISHPMNATEMQRWLLHTTTGLNRKVSGL
ncbi:putative bifunctional diguanylate cyclase/phosphodiesterase [Granulosicoccus sp. 3-233]|uniref:putative bifunctional diguanylate cyclase/phosphodiesterase n=1 Tax=Granulosicoccus sp. 3-233 TaxID=3417969 RepID=UPI003D3417DC